VEFAIWFWSRDFSEEMLLTERRRELREVGRRHGIPATDLDSYKRAFDSLAAGSRGEVDCGAFGRLLQKLLRPPNGLELPDNRIRMLWKQADLQGRGTVDFEEFVSFYRRCFDDPSTSTCAISTFYSNLRPVAV